MTLRSAPPRLANGVLLRPLTARSIILSTLLGAPGGAATPNELVLIARNFEITDNALRAALSRMLAAGDVGRRDGRYQLSDRLEIRQQRQEQAVRPPQDAWDGTWQVAVVTTAGRSPTDRAELRTTFRNAGLGELREGVWMRPANPGAALVDTGDILELGAARPATDPDTLVEQLFDLPGWATTARHLADAYRQAATDIDRFTIMAATVRHLLADPALPASLVPADYPAPVLRQLYADYRCELGTAPHRPSQPTTGATAERTYASARAHPRVI